MKCFQLLNYLRLEFLIFLFGLFNQLFPIFLVDLYTKIYIYVLTIAENEREGAWDESEDISGLESSVARHSRLDVSHVRNKFDYRYHLSYNLKWIF